MNIRIEKRDGTDVVVRDDLPGWERPATPDELTLWLGGVAAGKQAVVEPLVQPDISTLARSDPKRQSAEICYCHCDDHDARACHGWHGQQDEPPCHCICHGPSLPPEPVPADKPKPPKADGHGTLRYVSPAGRAYTLHPSDPSALVWEPYYRDLARWWEARASQPPSAGCSIHGECPVCKAERALGDPRVGVTGP